MKKLVIGDPHVQISQLEDAEALFAAILNIIDETQPDVAMLLGDQHNNFTVVRTEVTHFLQWWLAKMAERTKVVLINGNHDMSGDSSSTASALDSYKFMDNVMVVPPESVIELDSNTIVVSYCHTEEKFRKNLEMYPNHKYVFCHQTLKGSKYDNGLPAMDGYSLVGLESRFIVSGHIHSAQMYDNVWYPGSPRWTTQNDINKHKEIVLLDDNQAIIKKWDTSTWCSKMYEYFDRQDAPIPVMAKPKPNDVVVVNIHGDPAFIRERTAFWSGARIRTFKTVQKEYAVSEKQGVDQAFASHLEAFVPRKSVTKESLRELCRTRLQI